MTALEWFYQRILAKDIKEVFEQAKEMEKQQIIDAFETGDKYKFEVSGEQYYNETFKNTEK